MLYVVKTENFEKELETRKELITFVEELKNKQIAYEIFEREYNASSSKIVHETKFKLTLTFNEKRRLDTQQINKSKLSDVFEYFAETEPKIKKWFYENKPTTPTIIDLKEMYGRAHYESMVELARGHNFKELAEHFGFFVADLKSERNRQLVLIIPRDYKLKYQTIKVTLPYGYNAGLVIGKGGGNLRYSLDRLNQEYGTNFKAVILS